MDAIRKKISHFTLKLQSQTQVPLWSIANEKMIYAAAINEKPAWGPRLWYLYRIMSIAYKIKTSDLLIFCVGLYRALSVWWIVKKNTLKSQQRHQFKRIFAGFGASSEEYLYTDYVKQSQDQPLRINWATHEGLHELGCPSLLAIFFILMSYSFGYTAKLNHAIPEIAYNTKSFLTICAFNIGSYAFYRSFWKQAKSYGVSEVTFLVLDIPCFSSIDENIKTIYLQHGLMALTILVPRLQMIEVLTSQEESYLRHTLKNVRIVRNSRKMTNKSAKNNVLMLLSLNVFHEERLLACETLIKWAAKAGLQIVIRPTRSVSDVELTVIRQRIPHALFDDLTITLYNSFEKWRPKLVAAWTSTGLATILDYGSLPISLYDPDIKEAWDNMIYPMKYKVLFWPRDESIIENTIQSENAYYSQLTNLKSYQEQYVD